MYETNTIRAIIGGIISVIILFSSFLSSIYAQEEERMLVRIHLSSSDQIQQLEKMQLDLASLKITDHADAVVNQKELRELEYRGFTYEILPPPDKANLWDPEYHSYEEMYAELDSLCKAYPDITELYQIGHSQQYHYPIWTIKISDNADVDEDEPTVNYDGMHHAREPMGMESCMVLINFLLSNYGTDPQVTGWVDNIEIWVTPILNTEGYKYLVDNDLSSPWWRKNLRDNNNNQQIDPNYDGVDLNRNYDYRFTEGGSSDWGSWTYRGPYPFSESETQAKRDLALREHFLCSLTYHSYGEVVFYTRGLWRRTIPETPLLDDFAYEIGRRIPQHSETGTYEPQGGTNSTNMSYPWMFAVAGTYEFLVETGQEFIPPGPVALKIAEDNLLGALYLLEKTIDGPGVTGRVTDTETGAPVVATVKILEYFTSRFTPRTTEATYGRFYRFTAPGTYSLEVSAPGYIPQKITGIKVENSGWTNVTFALEWGPTIVYESHTIDDDSTGQSLGNGNGIANINETIELFLNLKNIGKIDADSVTAVLSTASPYVKILENTQNFGSIDRDVTASSVDPYVFYVKPQCRDGYEIEFKLTITDSSGLKWEDKFTVPVSAPVLEISEIVIHDNGGNNNGKLEPGENANLEIILTNSGSQGATEVQAILACRDTYLTLVSDKDTTAAIASGAQGSIFLGVSLAPEAPNPHIVSFNLYLSTQETYVTTTYFRIVCVSGFFDNMEYDKSGWTHGVRGNPINTHDDWQWGTPQGKAGDPSRAYSGIRCWGTDLGYDDYEGYSWNGYYQHNVDNFLSTPAINCTGYTNVGLRFRRWLNVAAGDVATIRVNDQLVWSSPPTGLYQSSWTEQTIDISSIADNNPCVVITFGMTTNGNVWAGGWNIDDVLVKNQLMSEVSEKRIEHVPQTFSLSQNYPNPFNPTTEIQYQLSRKAKITLKIYNLLGQEIQTLIDEEKEAGSFIAKWDGTDSKGIQAASGLYFYRLIAQDNQGNELFSQIRKMTLIR